MEKVFTQSTHSRMSHQKSEVTSSIRVESNFNQYMQFELVSIHLYRSLIWYVAMEYFLGGLCTLNFVKLFLTSHPPQSNSPCDDHICQNLIRTPTVTKRMIGMDLSLCLLSNSCVCTEHIWVFSTSFKYLTSQVREELYVLLLCILLCAIWNAHKENATPRNFFGEDLRPSHHTALSCASFIFEI